MKITVTCLSLLFILTLWGTIAQMNDGLYLAQERYFNSFFFMAGGIVPFPGARLVLWVFFINLVAATVESFVYKWEKIGLIVTHGGLLLFFVAAFVTFHGTVESNVTLLEGAGTNLSTSYNEWELSIWTKGQGEYDVYAMDVKQLEPGQRLNFAEVGISLVVDQYYRNCEAYLATESTEAITARNASGIKTLKWAPIDKEPGKNFPGGIFRIEGSDEKDLKVLLHGAETNSTRIQKDNQIYYLKLRWKRYELPFIIKLKDFKKELHPNTMMARSYESLVEITPSEGGEREVLISMNNPLRYKDLALYQSSYSADQYGRELSTLSVVKNAGRLLPYISSLLVSVGLLLHLIMMAFKKKLRPKV